MPTIFNGSSRDKALSHGGWGSWLGLAISRAMVAAHAERSKRKPRERPGSNFYVTLKTVAAPVVAPSDRAKKRSKDWLTGFTSTKP